MMSFFVFRIYGASGAPVSRPWHATQEILGLAAFEHLTRHLHAACEFAVAENLLRRSSAEGWP
jgi:hypothetical protein